MDLATLQARLTDAQLAYHQLMIGKGTASVTIEGRSVSYSRTDMVNLAAYISDLQRQISALTSTQVRRGPLLATF